ncbi:MAG: hypothetical protein EBW14_19765 [Oxalobacteraceae bacterium]|nr:hypothetical protein [Oxalobacteraceae bacterium]
MVQLYLMLYHIIKQLTYKKLRMLQKDLGLELDFLQMAYMNGNIGMIFICGTAFWFSHLAVIMVLILKTYISRILAPIKL